MYSKELHKLSGTTQKITSAYHPQGVGNSNRIIFNLNVYKYIYIYIYICVCVYGRSLGKNSLSINVTVRL